MKRIGLLWMGILPLALLAACNDVKTPDGRIPAQYADAARSALAGSYSGTFNGVSAELTIAFVGDRPQLTASRDLIDPRCESSIGQLVRFKPVKRNGSETVVAAQFAFDPNACKRVQGRTLDLRIKSRIDTGTIVEVSLLDYSAPVYGNCGPFAAYPAWCEPPARSDSYLTGAFTKD